MSRSTRLAECPDCGTHYVWTGDVFRCGGCTAPDFHELAPADIYVEHNERWRAVPNPNGAGFVLAVDTFEPVDEEKSSGDRTERAHRWNDDLDDDFDPPGPYDDYTPRDLDVLADEAADRHYDRD